MTREEVFEKLDGVFQDVFDDKDIHVTDTTTSSDIEGWDSLVHISLISAIEGVFDIEFDIDEISAMKNVGKMADMILSKIA